MSATSELYQKWTRGRNWRELAYEMASKLDSIPTNQGDEDNPQDQEMEDGRIKDGELIFDLVNALERALQWVPSNAVDTEAAKSQPISECRTRDYIHRLLERAKRNWTSPRSSSPPGQKEGGG